MAVVAVRTSSVQPLVDVAVPVLLAVLSVTQLVADRPPGNPGLLTVTALASVLPLAARRRAPLAVTAVVLAAVLGQTLVTGGEPPTFASFLGVMVCVYTLARESRPAVAAAGVGLVAVVVTATALVQARTAPIQPFEAVYPLVYFGIAGGLGAFVRQRSLRLSAIEERATALEGELARETELAAAEERARIARELHDVVAHGLSLMVVQAEAAEELLGRSPEAARQPLHRVQDTGRESLAEMRRLLGVLRTPDAGPPTTRPQPSLRRVPELVLESADLGLPVELVVDGEPVELPAGRDLAAFRIVQEALTNVRRHSGARSACVRLTWSPTELRIAVTDDGHGRTGSSAGHGLVGMRERATLYGGTFEAGPADGGGFSVRATLPVGEPAP